MSAPPPASVTVTINHDANNVIVIHNSILTTCLQEKHCVTLASFAITNLSANRVRGSSEQRSTRRPPARAWQIHNHHNSMMSSARNSSITIWHKYNGAITTRKVGNMHHTCCRQEPVKHVPASSSTRRLSATSKRPQLYTIYVPNQINVFVEEHTMEER